MTDTPLDDTLTDHTPTAGETTAAIERSPIAEGLARIGVSIGAQRTELYRHEHDRAALVGWWAALGYEVAPPSTRAVPLNWFPWTLGNIRQAHHVFVRNAGPLPVTPDSSARIRNLRMGSSLYLPVDDRGQAVGAVCAYWATERDDWDAAQAESLAELARALFDQV